jgi:hypothetical protein
VLALYDRARRAGNGDATGQVQGQPGSMASAAAALMQPEVIERLRALKAVVQGQYL